MPASAKRTCPNCGARLQMKFVDCIYRRNINGRLTPAESTAGKEVVFTCPRCVYAESD